MTRFAILLAAAAVVLPAQKAPARKPAPAAQSKPVPPAPPQVFAVETISVEGNKLYSSQAIAAVAGLTTGVPGEKEKFDAARDRLVSTGVFTTVGYRYGPAASGKGYALVFEVAELDQLLPYKFDRLGQDEAVIRAWLKAKIPLFGQNIPGNQPVIDSYRDAVQALLKEKGSAETVRAKVTSDGPSDLHVLFYPAGAPPVVAEVYFKGGKAIPEKALQRAIAPAAIGAEFRDDRFQEILALGLLPIYEAQGRLRAKFTKLETAPARGGVKGLAVTVTVDEGEVYTLGDVRVEGTQTFNKELARVSELSTGEVLNFDQVKQGREKLLRAMRRNGYMKAKGEIERSIDDKKKSVEVTYRVDPGPQFNFGKLFVKGLDLHGEHEIKKLWNLPAGKTFNAEYADYFLNRVREDGYFDDLGETKPEVTLDEGALLADVTLVFKAAPAKPGEKREPRRRKF